MAETAGGWRVWPGRFLQLHGCVWVASEGEFINLEQWRKAARPSETVSAGTEVVLGFRGGDGGVLVAARRTDGLLSLLGSWDEVNVEDADDILRATAANHRVSMVYCSYTPAWATMVDGWRNQLGRRGGWTWT